MEMVQRRPETHVQLARTPGIGERKLELYGDEFLEAIRDHSGQRGGGGIAEQPTAEESLALFRLGLGVEQIAARRELKPSTIYTHLAQAVARGTLDALEVTGLSAEEAARIERVWRNLPQDRPGAIKPLFEALEGRYDYGVLRCLLVSWGESN